MGNDIYILDLIDNSTKNFFNKNTGFLNFLILFYFQLIQKFRSTGFFKNFVLKISNRYSYYNEYISKEELEILCKINTNKTIREISAKLFYLYSGYKNNKNLRYDEIKIPDIKGIIKRYKEDKARILINKEDENEIVKMFVIIVKKYHNEYYKETLLTIMSSKFDYNFKISLLHILSPEICGLIHKKLTNFDELENFINETNSYLELLIRIKKEISKKKNNKLKEILKEYYNLDKLTLIFLLDDIIEFFDNNSKLLDYVNSYNINYYTITDTLCKLLGKSQAEELSRIIFKNILNKLQKLDKKTQEKIKKILKVNEAIQEILL